MKKIIFVLFLVLVGLEGFGQGGQPIRPYNENGYTIASAKEFVVGTSALSANYRRELLRIVNAGLKASGETLVVNETHLWWILDSTSYGQRTFSSFTNSRRVGDRIEFYQDKNFTGTVSVFRYGKCELVLYKTICMNLLEVPVVASQLTQQQTSPTQPAPAGRVDTVIVVVQATQSQDCCCKEQPVQQQQYEEPYFQSVPKPQPQYVAYQPQPHYQPQPYYQPQPRPQPHYQPQPQPTPHGTGAGPRPGYQGTGSAGRPSGYATGSGGRPSGSGGGGRR